MQRIPLLLPVVFVICAGCSSDGLNRASVEGNVAIDEKPLEKGFVNWYPLDAQGPTVGADVINGRYKLDKKNGPAVGSYRVEIQGWPIKTGKKRPSAMDPKIMEDELVDPVPAKYRIAGMGKSAKEELKATVKSGKNVINFDLTSD